MTVTPLTREQKLMAEQVVQLGNIAEAIRAAAMGENSSDLMQEIQDLKQQLQTLARNVLNYRQHWLHPLLR